MASTDRQQRLGGAVTAMISGMRSRQAEAEFTGKLMQGLQHNAVQVQRAVGDLLRQRLPPQQRAQLQSRAQPRRSRPQDAGFAAIIPGDGVAEQVLTSGLTNFLQLYNAAIIGRLVLTWFPNPPQIIAGPLSTLCDPYLNLFRGIIPPLGGTLDLSPILAFVVLDLFTNTAAALPAEMGPDGQLVRAPKQKPLQWLRPSRAAQAWRQRMVAQRRRRQAQA
ncbi:hypothetical protein WJX72_007614 [[Myrmecia] bisecta]|uniref:Uncharacterized protein n=1 Tax=[Myrmecia] bisecta TaxID=41462 RepID=A0AAW1QRH9_9CHLO